MVIDLTSFYISLIARTIIVSYLLLIVFRAVLWGDNLNERY